MYGKPLWAHKASFTFQAGTSGDNDKPVDDDFCIYVTDLEQTDNTDVREVLHPDWDLLWGNEMENIFSPWTDAEEMQETDETLTPLDTIEKARAWLLSIGMVEDPDGGDEENDEELPEIDWRSLL